MAALRDVLTLIFDEAAQSGHALPDQVQTQIELALRKAWPGERVYIAQANSPRDPSRAERIRQACRRLPVKVVARRYGVTPQRVYQLTKK